MPVLSQVVGATGGVQSNLEIANLVFGLISSIGGIAVALLAVYVGKRMAEERNLRAQERQEDRERTDEMYTKLFNLFSDLKAQLDREYLKVLLEIGEKYAQKPDTIDRISRADAKADAAHKRIDDLDKEVSRIRYGGRRADGNTP